MLNIGYNRQTQKNARIGTNDVGRSAHHHQALLLAQGFDEVHASAIARKVTAAERDENSDIKSNRKPVLFLRAREKPTSDKSRNEHCDGDVH
jgi:hypothetical protein